MRTLPRHPPLHHRLLVPAATALVVALLLAGCGVSANSDDVDQSEIFMDLTVESSFQPNSEITIRVEYEQPYPVVIAVDCDLLESDEKTVVTNVLGQQIPANPAGGPVGTATPVSGVFEQAFRAPAEPGRYLVECRTRDDENNEIDEWITIRE